MWRIKTAEGKIGVPALKAAMGCWGAAADALKGGFGWTSDVAHLTVHSYLSGGLLWCAKRSAAAVRVQST